MFEVLNFDGLITDLIDNIFPSKKFFLLIFSI